MTDVASKAANAVADTVKGVAKAVDPKKGEAAPMHGRTAIVTGWPYRLRAMPCAFPWLAADALLLKLNPGDRFCARAACITSRSIASQLLRNAGANAGLGYETSLAIAKAGGHVVMAVRNPQKGEE